MQAVLSFVWRDKCMMHVCSMQVQQPKQLSSDHRLFLNGGARGGARTRKAFWRRFSTRVRPQLRTMRMSVAGMERPLAPASTMRRNARTTSSAFPQPPPCSSRFHVSTSVTDFADFCPPAHQLRIILSHNLHSEGSSSIGAHICTPWKVHEVLSITQYCQDSLLTFPRPALEKPEM